MPTGLAGSQAGHVSRIGTYDGYLLIHVLLSLKVIGRRVFSIVGRPPHQIFLVECAGRRLVPMIDF